MSTLNDCFTCRGWNQINYAYSLMLIKTDLIIIGTKQQGNKIVDYFAIKLLGNDASPSEPIWNLGVAFDSDFYFPQYILLQLQCMQKCMAHLTFIDPHLSLPLIKQLHWLPDVYPVRLKVATVTYCTLNLLHFPHRAFFVAVPTIWNKFFITIKFSATIVTFRQQF